MKKGKRGFRLRWKGLTGKKKAFLILLLAAVAGAAGFGGWMLKKGRQTLPRMEMSATQVQAKRETLSNSIVGTGNLETDTGESVKIPSGIVIDEIQAEEGDSVKKGTVLATVDQASLLGTIEEIQTEIQSLDSQIQESKEETETESVSAEVGGRIKRIYMEEGSDLKEVMIANGAVMLLSCDGKMAVTLETDVAIEKGDTVTVTLSGGNSVTGTIESVTGTKVTVTCTDSGIGMDDTAAVTASDGTVLGTGATYIHQSLALTATGGTVEEIAVSEDQAVEAGDTLYTLTSDSLSAQYQEQIEQREALAQTLQKLLEISETGTITSEQEGTIEEIYISDSQEESTGGSSSSAAGGTVQAAAMSYKQNNVSGSGSSLMLCSVSNITEDGETEDSEEEITDTEDEETKLQFSLVSGGFSQANQAVLETPATGGTPQTTVNAQDGSYTGKAEWDPKDSVFQEDTIYQASVTLYAGEGFCFGSDSIQGISTGILSGIFVSEDRHTLYFQVTYPATDKEEQKEIQMESQEKEQEEEEQEDSNQPEEQSTDNLQNTDTGQEQQAAETGTQNQESQTAQDTQETENKAESTSGEYDNTEITAFTIASEETMILSVNVDELDINSVETGQKAEVTMDAIEDETFEGTVTKVGNTASASSGVAKYTVDIRISKEEQMKAGMNASATIVVEEKENVVTIPVDALQERGNETFVYTKQDEEGNLTGEQMVTTGLSDGETVEITEGLSEGDTVYYQKQGQDLGTDGEEMQFPQDMGGEFPSMDDMPQGGPQGGGAMGGGSSQMPGGSGQR